jgi:predicted RND superfamily exporter protein
MRRKGRGGPSRLRFAATHPRHIHWESATSVQSFHDRVDDHFRALGRLIHAHPWRVIVLTSALTAILAGFLPTMTADFSNDSYLLPGDDIRQRFDAFRDEFGLDERTVVALEPPEVFDLEFLETLRSLHERIENEVPYVEEVLSLVNARNTYGQGDELVVEDLLEDWPETPEALGSRTRRIATRFSPTTPATRSS